LRGHFFPLSKWYPRKSNPPLIGAYFQAHS
jgi:hypothetical protein